MIRAFLFSIFCNSGYCNVVDVAEHRCGINLEVYDVLNRTLLPCVQHTDAAFNERVQSTVGSRACGNSVFEDRVGALDGERLLSAVCSNDVVDVERRRVCNRLAVFLVGGLEVDDIKRPDTETVDDIQLLLIGKQEVGQVVVRGVAELYACGATFQYGRMHKQSIEQSLAELPVVNLQLQYIRDIFLCVLQVFDRVGSLNGGQCHTVSGYLEPLRINRKEVTVINGELEVIARTVNGGFADATR